MELITEEQKEIQLAQSDLVRVRALVIETVENYRDACQIELQLKQAIKDAEAKFANMVKKTRDAYQEALDMRRDAVNPRQVALGLVQVMRLGYEQKQEELRQQREKEAQAEAAKRAVEDAEELAQVLEKSGEKELAKQARADVFMPVVSIPKELPKMKGVGTRTVWCFRVNKPARLPKAYMMPDEAKIQSVVSAQGKAAERMIPGIQVWSEEKAKGAAKPK